MKVFGASSNNHINADFKKRCTLFEAGYAER